MRYLICAAIMAANPAFAECIDGAVTDLAHTIIAQRGELPGLASRRFGGLEAYMLLRYGSDQAAVQAELDASGGKPSSDAPFVFEQYALSQNAAPDFASVLPDRSARPITAQDLLPYMHGEVAQALVDFLSSETNRYLMPGALGSAALLLPEEARRALATRA